MIIACATDDGLNFVKRHFGDANFYYIYQIKQNSITLLNKIKNTSEEEKQHADPTKAKGILSLLIDQNVDTALTKIYGPNIKRISKKLLPIIANQYLIEPTIKEIQINLDTINKLVDNSKNVYLNLKSMNLIEVNEK